MRFLVLHNNANALLGQAFNPAIPYTAQIVESESVDALLTSEPGFDVSYFLAYVGIPYMTAFGNEAWTLYAVNKRVVWHLADIEEASLT